MDELTKYIEANLKYRLGLISEAPDAPEKPTDSANSDEGGSDNDGGDNSADDIFSQDDIDNASKSMGGNSSDSGSDSSDGGDQPSDGGEDASDSQETAPEAGDQTGGQQQSDQQKVQELYTDSGDPKVDYSLTADANIRLARFKFKYSGIDPMSLMTDDEKKIGVRADELESRLTPDQYQLYKQKNHELRLEFPAIAERERRVIIYNTNIPIFYNDENGVSRVITNKRDLSTAISKVEKFMNKSFGEDWADNKKAIKFLQGIKINFSEERKIRPNLIPTSYFEPSGERGIIAFNKLFAELPPSIDKFIKNNIDSQEYKKSPLFRTFINDYTGEENEGSARISVYPVVRDANAPSPTEGTPDEGSDGSDSADSDGGDMSDDGGDSGADGGDMGAEETGGDEDLSGGL